MFSAQNRLSMLTKAFLVPPAAARPTASAPLSTPCLVSGKAVIMVLQLMTASYLAVVGGDEVLDGGCIMR